MRFFFSALTLFSLTVSNAYSLGSKAPDVEKPVPVAGIPDHYFLDAQTEGFNFKAASDLVVTPQCLKSSGIKTLILDAGHDDSSNSIRSDAKIRGGNGRYVILWPEVHEGQLNMVTAYLVYSYLMASPKLSSAQRTELQSMIRFTRLPGESRFGQYESEAGYGPIGGTITSGVSNRGARINSIMDHHRPYDSTRGSYSKSKVEDVSNEALFVSVHANSSDYYDEGDHIWIIPPNSQSRPSEVSRYLASFQEGFSKEMSDFLSVKGGDSSQVASLKRGAQSSANRGSIRISKHSVNLAVLSSSVQTPYKFLTEGFVMNGKVGHLAHLEIGQSNSKKLVFQRGGSVVKRYDVSELYLSYAKSIARSIQTEHGCN